MPLKDLLHTKFTDADFTAVETALTEVETTILGKTINLTPDERRRYASISEQNKLVVEKVNDYRQSNPSMNSPQVDWTEFVSDFVTRKRIELIINRLTSIVEQFSDTKMLHDNDNYKDSLTQYSYITYLSNQEVAGSTSIKEDLGQFFESMGGSSKNI